MTVVAIARVKDEADIIEAAVTRMRAQVDHVIVEDNASTDGTLDILQALHVELLEDPTLGYYQSRAMSRLAAHAVREHGATWIVPFDADEMWRSRERRIADDLAALDPSILVAQGLLYDHVSTSEDADTSDPIARMCWRRLHPTPFRKVAVRGLPRVTIHQGNHSAEFAGVRHPPAAVDLFEIRHFPIRSPEQWVRKAINGAAAYAATDLPDAMGAHWRDWGRFIERHGEDALKAAFYEHYSFAGPATRDDLIFDPCP